MELSPSASSIVTLLKNISELIVVSNKRQEAKDVMTATVVYASNNNIRIPKEKVDMFYAKLLDARPYTLSYLVMDIAKDVMIIDSKDKKAKHFNR